MSKIASHKDHSEMEMQERPVSHDIFHAVQAHYHREFTYLQTRKLREWLDEMVAEDIHYWLPVMELRYTKDKPYVPTPDDPAIYNDNYKNLKKRVEQFCTGLVWTEDPPSRIRYYLSNLEVFESRVSNEYQTRCNIFVVRHGGVDERYMHSYGREDVIRRDDNGNFRVARRKLIFDARVIDDKNLYFFT